MSSEPIEFIESQKIREKMESFLCSDGMAVRWRRSHSKMAVETAAKDCDEEEDTSRSFFAENTNHSLLKVLRRNRVWR